MRDQRTKLQFTSAAMLTLILHQTALAEPPVNVPALPSPEQPTQAAPTEPAASENTEPVSAAEAAAGATEAISTSNAPPEKPATADAAPPAQTQPEDAVNMPAPGTAPAQPEAAMRTPPPPPPAMADVHERMNQGRAEMMQERMRRYDELRTRAAEVGLELPETPPWDQAGFQPLQMPAPPQMGMPETAGDDRGPMTPEERNARREERYQMMRERAMQRGVEFPETPPWKLMNDEERQAHWEKMRNMSPEERQAMREQHWQAMRKRAQEKGIEMPETPPWKQAEQRRAEMKARWDSYRATLDAMTPEQKEAVQAIYGSGQSGSAPPAMGRMTPPVMPMLAPYGQPGAGIPPGTGLPGFGYGRQPMYPGSAQGWHGREQGGFQAPPPPAADFNQGW